MAIAGISEMLLNSIAPARTKKRKKRKKILLDFKNQSQSM